MRGPFILTVEGKEDAIRILAAQLDIPGRPTTISTIGPCVPSDGAVEGNNRACAVLWVVRAHPSLDRVRVGAGSVGGQAGGQEGGNVEHDAEATEEPGGARADRHGRPNKIPTYILQAL